MITKKLLPAMLITTMVVLLSAVFSATAFAQSNELRKQEEIASQFTTVNDLLEKAKQEQIKAFTGSWEGVLTPEDGGPPPFRILFTFGADGTVVVSDAGPPTPHLNTAEHGAWERTGYNEFTIIYKQFLFDGEGNLSNTFKGRVKFKLDRFTNEIDGAVKVDIYDVDGNTIIAGAGTVKCTKIRVEPLE